MKRVFRALLWSLVLVCAFLGAFLARKLAAPARLGLHTPTHPSQGYPAEPSPLSPSQKTISAQSTSSVALYSLITEPQDGIAPVLVAIRNAKRSIDVIMYQFEDQEIEQTLAAAAERGVAVRVLLDGGQYGSNATRATGVNEPAFEYFTLHDVPVHWTSAHFALTHEKSLVIDGATLFVLTFNFTPQYYASSRDFGVVDRNAVDVSAAEKVFTSDWNDGVSFPSGDNLVWSPGSEDEMVALIANAKRFVEIYNEEMVDGPVIAALKSAAARSVSVYVVMTYSNSWVRAFRELTAAGVSIRIFSQSAPLYIHAKMILADGIVAFLGSENFSAASLNDNRELGIVLTNPIILKSLAETFDVDWQNATPFN